MSCVSVTMREMLSKLVITVAAAVRALALAGSPAAVPSWLHLAAVSVLSCLSVMLLFFWSVSQSGT